MQLRADADYGVLSHEVQHLTEGVTGKKNVVGITDFPGDHASIQKEGYSSEFRAMRVENRVRREHGFAVRGIDVSGSRIYADEEREEIMIPPPRYMKNFPTQ